MNTHLKLKSYKIFSKSGNDRTDKKGKTKAHQSGGFPKAVLLKDELLRKELLTQYFDDILNRDIAARHKIKETDKLENLALFYGTNFTRKFTFNGIKKIIDFAVRFKNNKLLDVARTFCELIKKG